MKIRLAVISVPSLSSRCHYSRNSSSALVPILLRRAVEYFNIRNDIDLILLLGDLTAQPDLAQPDQLRAILEASRTPFVVLPGVPEPLAEASPAISSPPDYLDCQGFRLIFLPDAPQQSDGLSHLLSAERTRFRRHCQSFPGPKIICHPYPLFPAGLSSSACHHAHSDTLVQEFQALRVVASISGHHPAGAQEYRHQGTSYLCPPAFVESPYPFQIVDYDEQGHATVTTHTLRLPDQLSPFNVDHHTHSPIAYCNENVDPDIELQLMEALHVDHIYVTEHSGQLYMSEPDYWGHDWFVHPLEHLSVFQNREEQFLQYMHKLPGDRFIPSTELDVDKGGNILASPVLLEATRGFRVGAVHALTDPSSPSAPEEFLFVCEKLASSGLINVLAHPYRMFTWTKNRVPEETFKPLVAILKKYGVAAELNFHNKNVPNPIFTQLCIDNGVKLSLGCDTHALFEMGFLNPHVDFLAALGYGPDSFEEILIH